MNKLTLILLLNLFFFDVTAQQDLLLFKKGNRTLALYTEDSYIAFQISNGQWFAGSITRIKNDSFYVRPLVIRYNMSGPDTAKLEPMPFVVGDLKAIPKPGVLVDYGGPDGYRISMAGGHVHWFWIKSGWIFRVGGAGYAALSIINWVVQGTPAFPYIGVACGAGVFLFGELLKFLYKPYYLLGKRYHLVAGPIVRSRDLQKK
jgi:hypothetical protein